MQVLPIFLVILAIVISEYIFTSKHRFYFLKAIILFLVLLLLSTVNFSIFFGIAALFIDRVHDMKLGNLFLLLAALVILSGLLLYEGLKRFNKHYHISEITLTLIEYCIQWSLIYVTVYQSIFNDQNSSYPQSGFTGSNYFAIIYFNLDCGCFIEEIST